MFGSAICFFVFFKFSSNGFPLCSFLFYLSGLNKQFSCIFWRNKYIGRFSSICGSHRRWIKWTCQHLFCEVFVIFQIIRWRTLIFQCGNSFVDEKKDILEAQYKVQVFPSNSYIFQASNIEILWMLVLLLS